jgi:hypothetical protein
MGLIVYGRQMLEVKMGINLRGAQIGMAEQFLDGTQIPARFQYVTGEGMSEHVRMHMLRQSQFDLPSFQSQLYRSAGDTLSSAAHK